MKEGGEAMEDMLQKIPAVVASGFVLVFVAALIGNFATLRGPIYNALVTSIIWGILFVALDVIYALYIEPPLVPTGKLWGYTAAGVLLAFVADLIGNKFEFTHQYANAFITSLIWAVAFTIILFLWWGGYLVN
jgi:hypothetical protein